MVNSGEDRRGTIDLDDIVRVLIQGRQLILAFTVTAGVLTLLVSLILPKQYEATATVAITRPETVFRFDPRIQTEIGLPSTEGLTDLALTHDILSGAMARAPEGMGDGFGSVESFQRSADARLNGNLLRLTVKHQEPVHAADLSNAWAEIFVSRIEEVYASSTVDDTIFERQAEGADQNWREAQEVLIAFQGRNGAAASRQRLRALEDALANVEYSHERMQLLIEDIETAEEVLRTEVPTSETTSWEEAVALMLSLRSLRTSQASLGSRSIQVSEGGGSSVAPAPDVQIQVGFGGSLETVAEEQALLGSLENRLEGQLERLDSEANGLEQAILEEQRRLEEYEQEHERLAEDVAIAKEVYEVLARKKREVTLAADQASDVASLAARAFPPAEPAHPAPIIYVLIGSVAGFWVAVLWLAGTSLVDR